MGVRAAGNQTTGGKIGGLIVGSDFFGNLFTDATKSAEPDNGSTKQLMGALTVAYVEGNTEAIINTANRVSASGEVKLLAHGQTISNARADGSLYKTPNILPGFSLEEVPKYAIGAAVGLSITNHENKAEIISGTIKAAGLSVDANLGNSASTLVVKAGHVPEDVKNKFGLAGAIAVHLSSTGNIARLSSAAKYELTGGEVNVNSEGNGRFVTVGDASGRRQRLGISVGGFTVPFQPSLNTTVGNVGIGAGIAVEVIGIKIHSIVEDGVKFNAPELDALNVNASYNARNYLEAAAGAEGGKAVVPVLALTVSALDVQAQLGASNEKETVVGNARVTASGAMHREVYANAKAVGAAVGVGGAFGISVVDDKVSAVMDRSVEADSILVDSASISRLFQTIYASARGATPQSSQIANKKPATGTTQADYDKMVQKGEYPLDENGDDMRNLFNESEADAFANKNTSMMSGLTGKLKNGAITPDKVTEMTANRPNAQTSEGSIQVAASMALNIHNNSSSARVLAGSIAAKGDAAVRSTVDTDAVIYADSSASNSTTGVGVAAAINYVNTDNTAAVEADYINVGGDMTVIAQLVEAEEKKTVEEILADILEYLSDTEGNAMLIEALVKSKGYDSLDELLANDPNYSAEYAALKAEDKQAVQQAVVDALIAQLKDEPTDTSSALLESMVENVLEQFLLALADANFVLNLLTGNGMESQMDVLAQKYGLTGKVMFERIRDLVSTALTLKYGNPSELDGVGSRISTSAVSGAGASNVGVAGSAAIAAIFNNAEATIVGYDEKEDNAINVGGILSIIGEAAQKVYTTASASAANNGLPAKNKAGNGAVASGKSVGIGASFAISIIEADAQATLGKNRNVSAAAMHVSAEVQNDIDTISVAGQDPIARQKSPEVVTPSLGEPPVAQNNTTTKEIAADAAVALNILKNKVHAVVGEGANLTLSGGNLVPTSVVIGKDAEENDLYDTANLFVRAWQRGQTYTASSGFAVGGSAAVGASVAANLASSDVLASLKGAGTVAGKLRVEAITSNEDEVNSLATVTGASLDRYFEKIRGLMTLLSFTDAPPTGGMNAAIVNKLNSFANPALSSTNKVVSGLPVLPSLMAMLQVTLPATPTGGTSVSNAVSGTGAAAPETQNGQGQSVNIAAAAAVNVTEHNSKAIVDGAFTAKELEVESESRANFRTYATGATITSASDINTNLISAGIAVSVNGNIADAQVGGNLIATGSESRN
ncbi:MAG: hypothetical protein IJA26_05360, partial [Clostridia bacterium]|nr:hypothetical protein [Clostridia bacterium]